MSPPRFGAGRLARQCRHVATGNNSTSSEMGNKPGHCPPVVMASWSSAAKVGWGGGGGGVVTTSYAHQTGRIVKEGVCCRASRRAFAAHCRHNARQENGCRRRCPAEPRVACWGVAARGGHRTVPPPPPPFSTRGVCNAPNTRSCTPQQARGTARPSRRKRYLSGGR